MIENHILDDMVLVPGGEFAMGEPDEVRLIDPVSEEDTLEDAHPQRLVYVDDFFIDVHPVTNRQYHEFVLQTGYPVPVGRIAYEPDNDYRDPYDWDERTWLYPDGLDDYPVVHVSWYDAAAYAEWAGKRLPTEAEWEKAARGTDGRPYPWGWEPPARIYGNFSLGESSIVERDGVLRMEPWPMPAEGLESVFAHPQGRSPYGCIDMLGNAWEWCADWYHKDFYTSMPAHNPQGLRQTASKSTRGCGRFWDEPHAALRQSKLPWERDCCLGFRCVISSDVLNCPKHGDAYHAIGSNNRFWCMDCGRPIPKPDYV